MNLEDPIQYRNHAYGKTHAHCHKCNKRVEFLMASFRDRYPDARCPLCNSTMWEALAYHNSNKIRAIPYKLLLKYSQGEAEPQAQDDPTPAASVKALSSRSSAARKAWETRRARAQGVA